VQAYNTFSALKRVARYATAEEQKMCFTLFHPYFQALSATLSASIILYYTKYLSRQNVLCTGGAYYVTYRFRFISNKSWDGGEGRGSFT
jgi:hypothetical protein